MVLAVASHVYQSISLSSLPLRYALATLVLLATVRVLSSTPSLTVRRILHGRTIIVSGGLTPLSAALIRSLASQGAQVILLHREPAAPEVQQVLHLIAVETGNERIYAETCDTSGNSMASIKAFTDRWSHSRKKSPLGDDLGPEQIDTLILFDDSSTIKIGIGSPDARAQYHAACLSAKVALIQGLQSSIAESNSRIISVVSPFYAASPLLPLPTAGIDLSSAVIWSRWQPWTFPASPALGSIAIMRHLAKEPNHLQSLSVTTGISRDWIVQMLTAHYTYIGWVLVVLLSPFIWALGKSTAECVTAIERGIMLDFKASSRSSLPTPAGSLVAGGRIVRLPRSEVTDPSFGKTLYLHEVNRFNNSIAT